MQFNGFLLSSVVDDLLFVYYVPYVTDTYTLSCFIIGFVDSIINEWNSCRHSNGFRCLKWIIKLFVQFIDSI